MLVPASEDVTYAPIAVAALLLASAGTCSGYFPKYLETSVCKPVQLLIPCHLPLPSITDAAIPFSAISDIIKRHKHIGGSANPAPIDLSTEVRGTLDGSYVSNINLDNVNSGTLDASRLPIINHNLLDNKGNLTHDQIDSLLTNLLEQDTQYKLSDLSIANRLQMLVALKKQSGFQYIDNTQLNTIVYVPGIFPNTSSNSSVGTTANFSDNSIPASIISATVNDIAPWSSGLGISSSVSDSVSVDIQAYTTKKNFTVAKNYNISQNIGFFENIKISGTTDDDADGYFQLSSPLNFRSLEQPVAGTFTTSSGWYRGLNFVPISTASGIKVDSRLYSYKMFTNPIAMDGVSHVGVGFSVGIGETNAKIGQVYMYLVLGTDTDPLYANDINVNFELYKPGDGNNNLTEITIYKNGSPIAITSGGTTNSSTLRPYCSPNDIETTLTDSTASVSVTNTDTLTIDVYNKVTITDASISGCATTVQSTVQVDGSFNYIALNNCNTIISGGLSAVSVVEKTLQE